MFANIAICQLQQPNDKEYEWKYECNTYYEKVPAAGIAFFLGIQALNLF
jgi:hypothetical protein